MDIHSGGGYWFIVTLLITKLLFDFWCQLNEKRIVERTIILIIILCIISPLLNIPRLQVLPFCIDNVKFALIFYAAGYLFKISKMMDEIVKIKWKLFPVVLLCTTWLMCTYFNDSLVLMYKNQFGNYFLFYFGAFAGILLFVFISVSINNLKKLFLYFGDTLWFFLMQFYVLDIFISVAIRVFENHAYIGSAFVFFGTVVCLIPINKFMKTYIEIILKL